MRTASIKIHNNQVLEVFVEKRKSGFEVWVIGPVKGCRVILSHHLTHDDLEAELEYARAGDLIWRNAVPSEIPGEIHPVANEAAANIKRGMFSDFGKLNQSLTYHVMGIINVPSLDRKGWNVAKKAIWGRWTDGVANVGFEPDAKLKWSCPTGRPHPFNSGVRGNGHVPDWWSFASWQLHLMNDEHKTGMRVAVLRVDEQELHISNDDDSPRLAHIFHRA
jgi:hypothetical protein